MAEWLYKCEKTLNFFFNNDPEDLSEEEALEAHRDKVTKSAQEPTYHELISVQSL